MKKHLLYHYVASWVDLIDGIIGIVTFGLYRPYWDFRFMSWDAKRTINKRMKQEKIA